MNDQEPKDMTAQDLLDALIKMGKEVDLSNMHISHDTTFIDFFSTDGPRIWKQIIVNESML